MMKIEILLVLVLVVQLSWGRSKEEWKSRTIYQVLTDRFARSDGNKDQCNNLGNYCGGDFRGLKNNLDYIQEMGFDAIWISPVIDNTDYGYHGYWARNWEKLNEHFGNEWELKELVDECHKRGIWVMLDVVANHVGPVGIDYHTIYPFNSPDHYHDYCEIRDEDFKHDQWRVENCRLAKLPDLKQENDWVQNTLLSWVKGIVSKFNFDGVRIDTTPEVPKWFWYKFREAAGLFMIGEVWDDRWDYLKGYIGPLDSVLNYGLFDALRGVFKGSSFSTFAEHASALQNYFGEELKYMGVFVDNHDNPRFLHDFGNWDNLIGALTFSLFFSGIPIVYYGDEQGYGGGSDPFNREELWSHLNRDTSIYQVLKKLIAVRRQYQVWNYNYQDLWHRDHMLAFTRGSVFIVVTNNNRQVEEDVPRMPFPDGARLCDALTNFNDCIVVWNKKVHLSIAGNKTKVYVPH